MKIQPSSSSERIGTPGLDVFKIAGASISGFLHSWKTGDQRRVRMPYTTTLEARLALFCEYHPHVRFYQRGDMSPAFASAYNIHAPLGAPYRIAYTYEGKPHDYLPDFVGMLCDGGLLIAEAGKEEEKSRGQAMAKAEAARRLAQLKGGCTGSGQTKISLSVVFTICCAFKPAASPFRPTKRSRRCW